MKPQDKPATPKVNTILLVDDNAVCRINTRLFLINFGYLVETASSAEDALSLFNPGVHDLVITDHRMPGMSGAEMALIIKSRSAQTPILMYTGSPPNNCPWIDRIIQRPAYPLFLKDALDDLLSKGAKPPLTP